MYSDNGTNFRGADNELQRHFATLINDDELKAVLANDGIDWHFVPSAASFGELWEAGVKSFKTYLKRAVEARTLSKAKFATLL